MTYVRFSGIMKSISIWKFFTEEIMSVNVNKRIKQLTDYAVKRELICEEDRAYMINSLLSALGAGAGFASALGASALGSSFLGSALGWPAIAK